MMTTHFSFKKMYENLHNFKVNFESISIRRNNLKKRYRDR